MKSAVLSLLAKTLPPAAMASKRQELRCIGQHVGKIHSDYGNKDAYHEALVLGFKHYLWYNNWDK